MDIRNAITEASVMADLRERVKQFGRQKKVAELLGFTPQYLCDVLKEKRPISPNLAEDMGYMRHIVYTVNGKRKRGGQ